MEGCLDPLGSSLHDFYRHSSRLFWMKNTNIWFQILIICRNMQTLLVQFHYNPIIWYILYLSRSFTSWANVLYLSASILHCLFYSNLNIRDVLYLGRYFANWANASILHRLFDVLLNIWIKSLTIFFYGFIACLRSFSKPASLVACICSSFKHLTQFSSQMTRTNCIDSS